MQDDMPNSRMPVVQMPNLDKLAKQGMKFSNAYGSPQCSPGRACVLTGQTSARSGYTVYMNPKGDEYYDTNKAT
jgi:arylsulfatase A